MQNVALLPSGALVGVVEPPQFASPFKTFSGRNHLT